MEDQVLAILLDMQKNMKSMDGRLDQLSQDVTGLKTDVSSLKAGQEVLQQDVIGLKADVTGLKTDVTGLKAGQEVLQQDVTGLKADVTSLKEGQLKINIKLENDIERKLTSLFDGHALDTEIINHISETVESINNAYAATDIVTGINSAEINKLKAKIG